MKTDIIDIFSKEYPEVDIRDFNFIRAKQKKNIGESISDDHMGQLMTLQRLHRLDNNSCTVAALLEAGLHSAHHIAQHPEDVFVARYEDALLMDEQEMRQLHRRAMAVKQKTRMLAVTLKSTAGSPFYRSSQMNSQPDDVQDYVKAIPNYQDFFGSLDYCSCDHDESLFGPAAYLADMLRIVYAYIDSTDINPNIPGDWHFKSRRPDISQIPLTAEMTTNLVPFIQIVIQVLEQYIADKTAWPDIYRQFSQLKYPFNQPFNLPLFRTRTYLDALDGPLVSVYQNFVTSPYSKPGANLPSQFNVAQEALKLSPTQYQLISTTLTTASEIATVYGAPSSRILPFDATGTVSTVKNQTTVTGKGTAFTAELVVGDLVLVGSQRNAVTAISSATELQVANSWLTASTNLAMSVSPIDDLSLTVNFSRQVGLSFDSLEFLLEQRLSPQEFEAGIASQLFINKGLAPSQYLAIEVDRVDPNWPVSMIRHIDLAALDRLNRFIRLAQTSGIDEENLDWFIQSQGGDEIDEACIKALGGARLLANSYAISLAEVIALYGPIKTIGVEDINRPKDLFDQLFNSPAILNSPAGSAPAFTATGTMSVDAADKKKVTGSSSDFQAQIAVGMRININGEVRVVDSVSATTQALSVSVAFAEAPQGAYGIVYPSEEISADALPIYHPSYSDNPLYTDPLLDWTVDPGKDTNASIRARLRAGLGVSDNDLTLIGNQALQALGINNGVVPLTVTNLSLLYSYAKTAQLNRLSVTNYLNLLELLGISKVDSLDSLIRVMENAVWFRSSQLNSFALQYALENKSNKSFNNETVLKALPNFLKSLWASAQDWLLNQKSFINQDINEELSADYFTKLSDSGTAFINQYGVVLQKSVNFSTIAFVDPLNASSFINAMIDPSQSAGAYDLLIDNQVLDANGVLSASFTSSTDLSYLFPNVTPQSTRDAMIAQVRKVLLETQSRINYVVSTLLTYGGAPTEENPNQGIQQFNLSEQLALFYRADTLTVLDLSPLIATDVDLGYFVAAFLQPPGSSISAPMQQFIELMNRVLVLVDQLKLSTTDIRSIIQNPAPFGFSTFDEINIQVVRSVWLYKWLMLEFNDTQNRLALYFQQPITGAANEPKFENLALLTGWNQAQIELLVDTLFSQDERYNTVAGIVHMKSCFDLGGKLTLSMNLLLMLAELGTLGADVTNDEWSQYNDAAVVAIGALKARYDGPEWLENYRPSLDTVNEKSRDVLAAYALYLYRQTYPQFTSYDDLYDYLLIDIEMSGCSDISYIKQAILSVQLYMNRAHMMLEPGVSKLPIPTTWWTWLSSYRLWEANRKIFLYPENYLEPELRSDSTPLFNGARDGLTANDITPETVNDVYLDYFEGFNILAGLKQVGAYYGKAPDPAVPGSIVDTVVIVARTAEEPYSYYIQRKVANLSWTSWEKIDQTIAAETAAPVFAFNRLFLFWVEQSDSSVSEVKGGNASNSVDTHAVIKYSFINASGRWVNPQTLSEMVIDFDPMQDKYSTPQINPSDIQVSDIEWRTVSPVVIRGENEADQRILLNFGSFYASKSGTVKPTAPDAAKIPNPDAYTLAEQLYNSSLFNWTADASGLQGATFYNQGILLDPSLNTSPTNVFALSVKVFVDPPMPYIPFTPRVVLPPGQVPTLSIAEMDNIYLLNYTGQGAGYPIVPDQPPVPLMYHVSDRSGRSTPVVNMPFWFIFNNAAETFLIRSTQKNLKKIEDITINNEGLSKQTNETDLTALPFTDDPQKIKDIQWSVERLSTGADSRLTQALFAGGVPALLDVTMQVTPKNPLYPFSRFYQTPGGPTPPPNLIPPALMAGDSIDYNGPYGRYFYEVFLYMPWMASNQLRQNQDFEQAKTWLEYIFNPTVPEGADPTAQNPKDRFWRFVEFRDYTVESLLEILSDPAQIKVYNDQPFDPHAVAQLRTSAYQKAIVMRYVDLLLEWGDYEFTLDTWESITRATLLYILAREILGPKPVDVGPCQQQEPLSFDDIQQQYGDDIPQFLIGLENALPTDSQTVTVAGSETEAATESQQDRFVPFNDLDIYFCVPENIELVAYWDKVEDRLFKIRHCMNIQGVVRQLALFEPPIDPFALVKAVAGGASPQAVQQLPTSAPPYRFSTAMALAKNFTAQLAQIGNALLSVLEKADAEELAQIQSAQELKILDLTTRVRELQIEELQETLSGLDISLEASSVDHSYYQGLVDQGLLPSESLHIAMVVLSSVLNTAGSAVQAAAALGYLVPNAGSPFAMTYGGKQLGASLTAAGSVLQILSDIAGTVGTVSQTISGYERREQDWQHQLTQTGFNTDQLKSQIAATELQLQSAQQQLTIHQATIANTEQTSDFYKTKFTSKELYQWMGGRLSTVLREAYRVALEMAMAAQQTYQYELNSNQQFINFEYWNSSYKGLLSGDQLALNLTQMEQAYYQNNTRSFEIEKTISLLSLDPRAFLDLQNDGECAFRFDELLFDEDYPGQYARQIKSISITIPAVLGPYQEFKATLIQLGNQILVEADEDAVAYLLGVGSDTPDSGTLRSNWRANQKIAISKGLQDNGTFALDFNDERYLPFEGTGAVSNWRLEMPKSNNLIDYESLSDVIINVKYTALDGGAVFASQVRQLLSSIPYMGQRAFNLAMTFSNAWYSFLHPVAAATSQQLNFDMQAAYFPANLQLGNITSLYVQLDLPEGVTLGGTLTATLSIDGEDETLIFNDSIIAQLTDIDISSWVDKTWSISVAKGDVPSGILDPESGLIAADKLTSMALLISYNATRPKD